MTGVDARSMGSAKKRMGGLKRLMPRSPSRGTRALHARIKFCLSERPGLIWT